MKFAVLILVIILISMFSVGDGRIKKVKQEKEIPDLFPEQPHLVYKFVLDSNSTTNSSDNNGSNTPIYEEAWFWITIVVILFAVVFCIALCAVKSCCCQSTNKLKYKPLDVAKYKTTTPETDKKRAEMAAKYGISSSSSYH